MAYSASGMSRKCCEEMGVCSNCEAAVISTLAIGPSMVVEAPSCA